MTLLAPPKEVLTFPITGRWIYQLLSERPMSMAEIRFRTQQTKDTVERNLRFLEAAGIVAFNGEDEQYTVMDGSYKNYGEVREIQAVATDNLKVALMKAGNRFHDFGVTQNVYLTYSRDETLFVAASNEQEAREKAREALNRVQGVRLSYEMTEDGELHPTLPIYSESQYAYMRLCAAVNETEKPYRMIRLKLSAKPLYAWTVLPASRGIPEGGVALRTMYPDMQARQTFSTVPASRVELGEDDYQRFGLRQDIYRTQEKGKVLYFLAESPEQANLILLDKGKEAAKAELAYEMTEDGFYPASARRPKAVKPTQPEEQENPVPTVGKPRARRAGRVRVRAQGES